MANNKLTLQKVFTAGWRNFIVKRRKPCRSNSGSCCYRVVDEHGERRCVIGWAMPLAWLIRIDNAEMTGNPIEDIATAFPEFFNKLYAPVPMYAYRKGKRELAKHVMLRDALAHAQDALHDKLVDNSGSWKARKQVRSAYEKFAKLYGLRVPKLKDNKNTRLKSKPDKSRDHGLTLQGIFNKAYKHFVYNNGKPAYNAADKNCAYIDQNGNRCAIGVALNKKQLAAIAALKAKIGHLPVACTLVDKFPEWFTKTALSRKYDDKSINLPMPFADVLNIMQQDLHDGLIDRATGVVRWKTGVNMKKCYDDFAERFGLRIPAPPKEVTQ